MKTSTVMVLWLIAIFDAFFWGGVAIIVHAPAWSIYAVMTVVFVVTFGIFLLCAMSHDADARAAKMQRK